MQTGGSLFQSRDGQSGLGDGRSGPGDEQSGPGDGQSGPGHDQSGPGDGQSGPVGTGTIFFRVGPTPKVFSE